MKTLTILTVALVLSISLGGAFSATPEQAAVLSKTDRDVVVLLHGLGRSKFAMRRLASRLEDAGFEVVRIGYRSLRRTPEQILEEVSMQINGCCLEVDRPVHFIGHSLGGLIVRAYLQDHSLDKLGRVVLMGTPNRGSELVDRFRDAWWVGIFGPTALALGTDEDSFPNSLGKPEYPVGVIAGVSNRSNEHLLPGADDGLVTVDATRFEGMTDFIVVETGHAAMRYDDEVVAQSIAFLKTGAFVKDGNATTP